METIPAESNIDTPTKRKRHKRTLPSFAQMRANLEQHLIDRKEKKPVERQPRKIRTLPPLAEMRAKLEQYLADREQKNHP